MVPVYDLRIPFGLTAEPDPAHVPSVLIVETEPGNESRGDRAGSGSGVRRAGVLPGGGATVAPARTGQGDAVRAGADPSPGRVPARTRRGSCLLGPRRR